MFSILGPDETHTARRRLLPATQQVKQVPGLCHYDYVVGIADTSILQPSLERKLWKLGFYGLIYRPVQGHSLLSLLPKTKLSSKEQENRLWCRRLALKPDVQHRITSNMLQPYCISYFFVGLTTKSPISRSTWKGQVAGNSKEYWPSCTACSVIRRWCNHHFSAIFAKKVVETAILWHFYGLINRPVQGHSLFGLLPKTKLGSKEQENRLWCIQLALKPDVQHKTSSNRLRRYCIGYFFIGLTTKSPISRSTWKGQAAGNLKEYWPSCTTCSAWCNHNVIVKRPNIAKKKTLPQKNQTFPWYWNQTSPLGSSISDPNFQGLWCRIWSPWIVVERI